MPYVFLFKQIKAVIYPDIKTWGFLGPYYFKKASRCQTGGDTPRIEDLEVAKIGLTTLAGI